MENDNGENVLSPNATKFQTTILESGSGFTTAGEIKEYLLKCIDEDNFVAWFDKGDLGSEELALFVTLFDEIKALVTNEGKGNTDVVNAGCTIAISDMVKAVALSAN
jgi:hypothetical protein